MSLPNHEGFATSGATRRRTFAGIVAWTIGLGIPLAGSRAGAGVQSVCTPNVCAVWDFYMGRYPVEVPILATGSAELDAVGFDVTFNRYRFEYLGMRPGALTRGWYDFEAQLSAGRVRVGGFDSGTHALQGTDTLAVLKFKLTEYVNGERLSIGGFVDDLAGASGCSALVTTALPPAANGSVAAYPADAPAINCYPTPDGTSLQVVLQTDVAIRGAEYRIEIFPPDPDATFAWIPPPGTSRCYGLPVDNTASVGDTTGVRIWFADCVEPVDGKILLGTVQVWGLGDQHDLRIWPHNRPSFGLPCPFLRLCGECPRNVSCLTPPRSSLYAFCARLNGMDCTNVCVTTRVSTQTWGMVKRIYR